MSDTSVASFAGRYSTSGTVDGVGTAALFGVTKATIPTANYVYVAERNRVRRITRASLAVAPWVGDLTSGDAAGVGTNAQFAGPRDILLATIASTETMFVADFGNQKAREKTTHSPPHTPSTSPLCYYHTYPPPPHPTTHPLLTFGCRLDLARESACALEPGLRCAAPAALMYHAYRQLRCVHCTRANVFQVKRILVTSMAAEEFVGSGSSEYTDGVGTNAALQGPSGLAISPDSATLYVSCATLIKRVVISSKSVTTLAGSTAGFGATLATCDF